MRMTKGQLREIIAESMGDHSELDEGLLSGLGRLAKGALDGLQIGLDIFGFVPFIGNAADTMNALISIVRGKPVDALLSVVSLFGPMGDIVGKGGKVLRYFMKKAQSNNFNPEEVAKKIGPGGIATVAAFKDELAKSDAPIEAILKALKTGDLDMLEGLLNFKVPNAAKPAAEKLLKKHGSQLDVNGISDAIEAISDVDLDELDKELELARKLRRRFSEGTVFGFVVGEKQINENIRQLAIRLREINND
jgi:hypothetical protein